MYMQQIINELLLKLTVVLYKYHNNIRSISWHEKLSLSAYYLPHAKDVSLYLTIILTIIKYDNFILSDIKPTFTHTQFSFR